MVALHLDNSTAKDCQILDLSDKHGITLIPVYIPIHPNVEAHYLSSEGWFLSGTCFLTLLRLHFITGVSQRWICWHPNIPINVNSITPWRVYWKVSGAPELSAFNHLWTYQVSYVFPPPASVSCVLSKFLVEHVIGQVRHLRLYAPCWMEAPWLFTVICMLEPIPHQ